MNELPTEVNLCQPKSTLSVQSDSYNENENSESSLNGPKYLKGDYTEKKLSLFFSSSLIIKPRYSMAQWRHPRTRDGQLAIFLVVPSGSVQIEDGIKAGLINSEQLQLSFSWPTALLDANGITKAMLSFCHDLNDGQGRLMAQGLRDYTYPLHFEVGQDVVPTCIITLRFPVKPNFDEDVIKFDGSDSTTIYVMRFQAFEERFATLKKRLVIRNIYRDESAKESATGQSATSAGTISESQNQNFRLTSAVTTE